jgi:hypothetical protein
MAINEPVIEVAESEIKAHYGGVKCYSGGHMRWM